MSTWRERLKAILILGPTLRTVRGWFRRGDRIGRIDARDYALTGKILQRLLRPDTTVVDVGANTGTFLARVVRLWPHGKYVTFEPIPHLAAGVRAAFPGVSVHTTAVSDTQGEFEFTQVVGIPALSGLKKRVDLPADEAVERIRVPVVTLDQTLPADLPLRIA